MSTVTGPTSTTPFAPFTPSPPADPRPWKWTREQYYKLGELGFFDGRRVELIRGEIVEMSPKNWSHVVGCRKTAESLERAFAGIGWVSRQEPVNLSDSDPEPDVSVLPGRVEDYADHPTTAALIVEVAESSFFYDTTTKAGLYAEKGIPEYWVLDLENRRLLVFRDPAPIPAGGASYRTQKVFGPADSVSPLATPSASVAVADLLP